VKKALLPTKSIFATVAATLGNLFVVCRKGKAFCECAFALHHQQTEKDKKNVEFAPFW